jgi:hypothetical protein
MGVKKTPARRGSVLSGNDRYATGAPAKRTIPTTKATQAGSAKGFATGRDGMRADTGLRTVEAGRSEKLRYSGDPRAHLIGKRP